MPKFAVVIPLFGALLMSILWGPTAQAANEVQLVKKTSQSFFIETGDYTISYDPEHLQMEAIRKLQKKHRPAATRNS